MLPPSSLQNRRAIAVTISILVVLTMIGVSISTIADIELHEAVPASQDLSVDETTYYEFVAPRLDRLVVEVNRVVEMVNGKSRDIIALSVSGDRIEQLTDEIVEFGERHRVPPRFAAVHALIVEGTGTAEFTFAKARAALTRFDFSGMTKLVSTFNDAASTLHLAQDELRDIAGNERAFGTQGPCARETSLSLDA